MPSRLTLRFTIKAVKINLVLIDHCHSLMLDKDGQCEDLIEAAGTNTYLQLRRQLPTELRKFIYILIHQQS